MGYFVSSRALTIPIIAMPRLFIISRSLTVIDVKKVLREKDEISWLSSE